MRKAIVVFLVLLMSFAAWPNHKGDAAEYASGLITVKLKNHLGNRSQIDFEVAGDYLIAESNTQLTPGVVYTLKFYNGNISLYIGSLRIKDYGTTLKLTPKVYEESNYVIIRNSIVHGYSRNLAYLGDMQFTKETNYIRPYNTVHLEDYLKGVVPYEMKPSWDIDALKAQALAARTYALGHYNSSAVIDDSESYQVYAGYPSYNSTSYITSDRAVEETRGEIITYNGTRISALYSSSNGGMILSNTNTWATLNSWHPYLQTKVDEYDKASDSPNLSWSYLIRKKQADITGKNLKEPGTWWNSVSEYDKSFTDNLKSKLYRDGSIGSDYELKIVEIPQMTFTTSFTSEDVLQGDITVKYILRYKPSNSFRLNSSGEIAVYTRTFTYESYSIRSMVGTREMKSPYIKSVNNSGDNIIVYGAGFGHGVGMSQYGAQAMASKFNKSYKDILSFYYPGIAISNTSAVSQRVGNVSINTDQGSPQSLNSTITVSANATGGYERLYKFFVRDSEGWKVIQDYSTASSVIWKPTAPGNYILNVHVKDKYSSKPYDAYKTMDYSIQEAAKLSSFSTDKASPQAVGTSIQLSAAADSVNNVEYKFWSYNRLTKEWILLKDYSSVQTASWTPSEPGDYQLVVHAREVGSTKSYDDYRTIEYKVNSVVNPIVINGFTSDKASPQYTNESILLTASASGGISKEYRFWSYNRVTKEWTLLQDYSAANTITWVPKVASDYQLVVHVREKGSTKSYEVYRAFDYKVVSNEPISISSFYSDKPSPQQTGTTIRFKAEASGGTTKEYRFWSYDRIAKIWTVIQDYSPADSVLWTPGKESDYQIVVHVRNQGSTKSYESYKAMDYKVINQVNPVVVTNIGTSLVSPQPANKAIEIVAEASGGTERQYRFWSYNRGTKEWTVLQEYSPVNKVVWTPDASGDYQLVVHVRSKDSTKSYEAYKAIDYKITMPQSLSISSFTTDKASPQAVNASINLTAKTVNGVNPQYRFWAYNRLTKEWTLLQNYSSNTTVNWVPKVSGDYQLVVHVRNADSTNSYDQYKAIDYKVSQ